MKKKHQMWNVAQPINVNLRLFNVNYMFFFTFKNCIYHKTTCNVQYSFSQYIVGLHELTVNQFIFLS